METVSEALRRLTDAGYADEYQARPGGLKSRSDGTVRPPEAFRIEEVARFEGESDPSDESAVFALASMTDGSKGTYTVAFGPLMDALDAEMVRKLTPADDRNPA
jgi:hypothetical protein